MQQKDSLFLISRYFRAPYCYYYLSTPNANFIPILYSLIFPEFGSTLAVISKASIACTFLIADESLRFRITIMLIDKKDCLIIETKDDFAENSYDVLSYVSILEGLWKQSELSTETML